jgi:hypothetical protein
MSLITISTASINYTSGTTDCQCSVAVDVPTIGTTYVGRSVSLASDDLGPDWTDADLCAAVAAKLDVDVADVSVAPGPVVWEEVKAAKLAAKRVTTAEPTEPTEPTDIIPETV